MLKFPSEFQISENAFYKLYEMKQASLSKELNIMN